MSSDLELVERINAAAKDAVEGCMDADGKRIKWGKEALNVPVVWEGTPTDEDRAVFELLESHLDQLQKLETSVAHNICMPFVDLRDMKLPGAK